MDKSKIIKELSKNGYDGYWRESMGFIACGISDDAGEPILGSFFKIMPHDDLCTLLYYKGNVEISKQYNSVKSLIEFLHSIFPVEEYKKGFRK